VGAITWNAADGTDIECGIAAIDAVVESGIGSNDTPGAIRFYTNHGTTSASERWRMTGSGVLVGGGQTPAGLAGDPADANFAELGPGYLNLARDDTAAAAQILFAKNGSAMATIQTSTNGLSLEVTNGFGSVVVNDAGVANTDFRVESDGDTHCFFVDSSTNTACFGASQPQQHARFFTTVGNSRPGYLTQNLTTGTTNNIAQFMSNGESVIGTINATNTGTAFNTSSDYRLKENVETLKDGLDRVNQLKPVQFTWATDGSLSEGFIAHEVDEVFSDAVTGEKDAVDDKGNIDPQQVDYGRITPLLVKAIQEQQEQIEELKAEIAKLKGE
jgi:hypothetical protein